MNADQPITEEQEIVRVLEEWNAKEKKRRRRERILAWIGLISYGVGFLIFFTALLGEYLHWWGEVPKRFSWLLPVFMAPSALHSIYKLFAYDHIRERSHHIAKILDVRAIGVMLNAVQNMGSPHPEPFTKPLTHLLPQLKASDASLLDAHQRAILYSSIGKDSSYVAGTDAEKTAYRLTALQAIEQIGDEKAIKPLKKIVADGSESDEILKAAHFALDVVKQRAEQTKESTTLLRASDDTAADSTLFKPAMPQDDAQDNLLRPVV
jgi:hypothetical protein